MKLPVYSSTIRRKEMDAVLTTMVSEKIGPGEMNQKLSQFAREFFVSEGVGAFRSSAIALRYALSALDLAPGSGVILSALAPYWQYQTVVSLGFDPVIADVNPDTALVTPETVEVAIARGGRVILVHESLGFLPDLPALLALNIPVIEDASQSVGASLAGKQAGSFGMFTIVGLEETDYLTAGGGALLLAPERRNAVVLKRLCDEAPLTDILPDINSALGFVQLKEMQRNTGLRTEIAAAFTRALMQSRHRTLLQQGEGVNAVYSFPVVLSSGLKEVRHYASRKDIEIDPVFESSIAGKLDDALEGCINAKSLLMRCVLFPLYPRLGNANVAKISKVLATLP